MALKTQQVKPLSMRAAIGTANAEKRTVEVVFSTGAKVLRSSWMDGPFYEELDMSSKAVRLDRLNSGAPFLMDHDGYRVADVPAVVESARLEGGKGYATVRFASKGIDPAADMLFDKIQDGIVRSVSVGYRVHKVEKIVTEGEKIPTMRVVDWTPMEISAVAMPADAGAGFRSDEPTNECEVITHRGEFPTTQKEGQRMTPEEIQKAQEAKFQAELAKRAAEAEAKEAAAVLAERSRVAGITHAVRAAKLDDGKLIDKLIADGTSIDSARAQVLELLVKRDEETPTESRVTGVEGKDAGSKFVRGAVSALLMATVPALVRKAKEAKVPGFEEVDENPGELRKFSLADFARESLELQGIKTRGLDRDELAKRAFTTRAGPYAGTADFPILLENLMGKILLGAYGTTPDTWSRICKVESVDDFRASPRYRTGSLTVLDALSEQGEFVNKGIPDGAKLTISTATKGNMIAISRQLVINDDMSALSDLMTKLGRAARLSIEVDFYALLALNGGLGPTVGANPFFHATNGNVNAVASDITALGIDADRVVMAQQKDISSNEYLDMRPEVLLIPVGKRMQAQILNSSAINPDANGKIQQPNGVQGQFRDIVDTARLSGTRRYLFGSPEVAPAFVVAFLKGQQSPVLESKDGWRTDGAEMKVRFDYLVQPFDVKGAVTNAGL